MSLLIEAAEVAEHFQWLLDGSEDSQLPGDREAVAAEMADVFIYLIMLADKLDINLIEATLRKIRLNEARYPEEHCQGAVPEPLEVEEGSVTGNLRYNRENTP